MPVWGGREKFLGASPFAAGAPGGTRGPLVLDMACTVTARGKLKYAAQRGEPIPPGLALDRDGRPTTDGNAAFEGVVLPFAGAKGAGLSMLMEVLCGVLTGAGFGGCIVLLMRRSADGTAALNQVQVDFDAQFGETPRAWMLGLGTAPDEVDLEQDANP